MSETAKERIVGLIVLICLALIIIPPFYDGKNPFESASTMPTHEIPKGPSFPEDKKFAKEMADVGSGRIKQIEQRVKESIPEEARNDSLLPPAEDNDSVIADFNAKEMTSKLLSDIAASTPLLKKKKEVNKLKQAWAVQVGSFEDENRAVILRDKLISMKYQAYIKSSVKNNKSIYRVFAGVSLDKEIAVEIQTKVTRDIESESAIVVPYIP